MMKVQYRILPVFMDTGSPCSILNPFEDKKEWQRFLATTADLGTQSSVRLTGVGGGKISTKRSVLLTFDVGGKTVK